MLIAALVEVQNYQDHRVQEYHSARADLSMHAVSPSLAPSLLESLVIFLWLYSSSLLPWQILELMWFRKREWLFWRMVPDVLITWPLLFIYIPTAPWPKCGTKGSIYIIMSRTQMGRDGVLNFSLGRHAPSPLNSSHWCHLWEFLPPSNNGTGEELRPQHMYPRGIPPNYINPWNSNENKSASQRCQH